MARTKYGASETSWLMDPSTGLALPNTTFEVWDSEVAGIKQIDLLNAAGSASAVVTTDALGYYKFSGPDGYSVGLWASGFGSARKLINPSDMSERITTNAAALLAQVFGTAQIPGLDVAKIISGVFAIARIPTGSTGTTVALGSHTHAGSVTALRGSMASAQAFTSNTTFTDLTGLGSAVAANSTYDFDVYVYFDGAQTGDLKLQFTGPAGATILGPATGPSSSVTGVVAPLQDSTHIFEAFSSSKVFGCAAAGITTCVRISVTVITGVTAGNVQLQGAQAASDATATTVHAGSLLEGYKVA